MIGRTKYVPYEKQVNVSQDINVTVTEKRAPTDESISILNEMQNKVVKNIVATLNTDSNLFIVSAIFYHDDLPFDRLKWAARFKLNGTDHEISGQMVGIRSDNLSYHNFQKVINMFIEAYSKEIAKIIAQQQFEKFLKFRS